MDRDGTAGGDALEATARVGSPGADLVEDVAFEARLAAARVRRAAALSSAAGSEGMARRDERPRPPRGFEKQMEAARARRADRLAGAAPGAAVAPSAVERHPVLAGLRGSRPAAVAVQASGPAPSDAVWPARRPTRARGMAGLGIAATLLLATGAAFWLMPDGGDVVVSRAATDFSEIAAPTPRRVLAPRAAAVASASLAVPVPDAATARRTTVEDPAPRRAAPSLPTTPGATAVPMSPAAPRPPVVASAASVRMGVPTAMFGPGVPAGEPAPQPVPAIRTAALRVSGQSADPVPSGATRSSIRPAVGGARRGLGGLTTPPSDPGPAPDPLPPRSVRTGAPSAPGPDAGRAGRTIGPAVRVPSAIAAVVSPFDPPRVSSRSMPALRARPAAFAPVSDVGVPDDDPRQPASPPVRAVAKADLVRAIRPAPPLPSLSVASARPAPLAGADARPSLPGASEAPVDPIRPVALAREAPPIGDLEPSCPLRFCGSGGRAPALAVMRLGGSDAPHLADGTLARLGFDHVTRHETALPVRRGQVRYFRDADAAVAGKLARETRSDLLDLTWYRPQPAAATVELWLPPAGAPE